jgi:hypothetical protein
MHADRDAMHREIRCLTVYIAVLHVWVPVLEAQACVGIQRELCAVRRIAFRVVDVRVSKCRAETENASPWSRLTY